MIVSVVILVAIILFLMVSVSVMYERHMECRLIHVDELVARGVDIQEAVKVAYKL